MFGELGGGWQLNAGSSQCDATLIARHLDIRCHVPETPERERVIRFVVDKSRASGTVFGGREFAAQRR